MSSMVHATPVASHAVLSAPVWSAPLWSAALVAVQAPWRRLQLAPPCGRAAKRRDLSCASIRSGRGASESLPAAGTYADTELRLPRKNDSFRTLGGFVYLNVVASPNLRTGPELSWSTPDSPREDLQKLRLLSPGWGLRYSWAGAPIAVGVSACSRIVMLGKVPLIDPLTSEARVEFRLP
jgi:hypothetical protein